MSFNELLQNPAALITLGVILVSLILSITALFISLYSKKRITRILNGKNSKDIDEVLMQIYKNLSVLDQFRTKTTADMNILNNKVGRAIQSVETVRFNPFKGTGSGGNQSFATAMIDEKGDGVIISSLYSSDRVSVFAKPISGLSSTFELTEEEANVLQLAANKLK